MNRIKNYNQFLMEGKLNENFTIRKDKLPKVGDLVDRVKYKDGDKIAFIDFKGVKDIPVHVIDGEDIVPQEVEATTA